MSNQVPSGGAVVSWPARLSHVVFSRWSAVTSACLIIATILGCMSITIGGRTEVAQPADLLVQEGEITIHGRGELDVYYPVAFASPPNLVIGEMFSWCEVVEQKADHFRIGNTTLLPRTVSWTAKGTRCNGGHESAAASAPVVSQGTVVGSPEPVSQPAQIADPSRVR
jgi:hypothetical protein